MAAQLGITHMTSLEKINDMHNIPFILSLTKENTKIYMSY